VRGHSSTWDVVIVGAGPAGGLTAYLLARRGLKVLIVERSPLPRAKVCGGCLNVPAAALLASCGLQHCIDAANSQTLEHITFCRGAGRVAMDGDFGFVIDRALLDAGIVRAACENGATVWDNCAATVSKQVNDVSRGVVLARGGSSAEHVLAQVVICADGLGHPSLADLVEFATTTHPESRFGLGVIDGRLESTGYAPGSLTMALGDEGYMGVARLADGRFRIGAAASRRGRYIARQPAAWLTQLVSSCGLPSIDGLETSTIKGTPLLTQRSKCLAGHRLLVVGDAAGYVEPITGEGMACALAGAAALAPVAAEACHGWRSDIPRRWASVLRRQVFARQGSNRLLAGALRRPHVSRLVFAAAACMPAAANRLARRINRLPSSSRSIL
jgi:flavin-dependent dehydrogenase